MSEMCRILSGFNLCRGETMQVLLKVYVEFGNAFFPGIVRKRCNKNVLILVLSLNRESFTNTMNDETERTAFIF